MVNSIELMMKFYLPSEMVFIFLFLLLGRK